MATGASLNGADLVGNGEQSGGAFCQVDAHNVGNALPVVLLPSVLMIMLRVKKGNSIPQSKVSKETIYTETAAEQKRDTGTTTTHASPRVWVGWGWGVWKE